MLAENLMVLLEKLGIERLKQRGDNIYGCCPIHGESRPSWGISIIHPHQYGCFACGAKGSLVSLLTQRFGYSSARALEICGMASRPELLAMIPNEGLSLATRNMQPDHGRELFNLNMLEPAGLAYLLRRGFSRDIIRKANIRFHREHRRLLFPWTLGNAFYGASSRSLTPKDALRTAYFQLAKHDALYAPNGCIDSKQPLIMVEGELDALRVMQAGFPNVVALGHGNCSKAQLNLALNFEARRWFLMFDNDTTGRALTASVYKQSQNAGVAQVDIFNYPRKLNVKDPADFSAAYLRRLLSAAHAGFTHRRLFAFDPRVVL